MDGPKVMESTISIITSTIHPPPAGQSSSFNQHRRRCWVEAFGPLCIGVVLGPTQVDPFQQVGPFRVGPGPAAQVGLAQVSLAQVRPVQAGQKQSGSLQVRSAQIGLFRPVSLSVSLQVSIILSQKCRFAESVGV